MAIKEEKSRAGGSFDGHTTLRRNAATKQNTTISEIQKIRRQNVDSGYSTSDGIDKRWSQELPTNGNASVSDNNGGSKWSPTPLHIRTNVDRNSPTTTATTASTFSPYQTSKSSTSTPALSPAGNNNNSAICNSSVNDEFKRPANPPDTSTPKRICSANNGSNSGGSNSNRFVTTHSFVFNIN